MSLKRRRGNQCKKKPNHESTIVRKKRKGKREMRAKSGAKDGKLGEKEAKWEFKNMGHQFEELSGRILEAVVQVHKALGPGFLEAIYEQAMAVAFRHRGIQFEKQKEVHIYFEGEDLGIHRIDLIVEGQIIVELKAVKTFEDIHYAQTKSYLKATGLHVGLLLNFNVATLAIKRIVL